MYGPYWYALHTHCWICLLGTILCASCTHLNARESDTRELFWMLGHNSVLWRLVDTGRGGNEPKSPAPCPSLRAWVGTRTTGPREAAFAIRTDREQTCRAKTWKLPYMCFLSFPCFSHTQPPGPRPLSPPNPGLRWLRVSTTSLCPADSPTYTLPPCSRPLSHLTLPIAGSPQVRQVCVAAVPAARAEADLPSDPMWTPAGQLQGK